jgi:hypothetical protein
MTDVRKRLAGSELFLAKPRKRRRKMLKVRILFGHDSFDEQFPQTCKVADVKAAIEQRKYCPVEAQILRFKNVVLDGTRFMLWLSILIVTLRR